MEEELDYSEFAPVAEVSPEEELDYSAFAPVVAEETRDAEELDYSAFAPAPAERQAPEQEYEGFAQELFEGIISGATKIPQGIAETLATGYDIAAGTDYASDVTKAGEDFREWLGVDPVGLTGTIPEVGVQFVLPGGLAAKAVGAASKAGKVGTFLKQVGAAGLVDVAVSTEDTTTLGDFFEGGPTQKADLVGLEGTEKALARAENQLKVGIEGALGTVAAPFIARAATEAAGGAATAIGQIPGATQTARVIQKAGHKVAQQAARLERARIAGENIGPVRAALADTFATLRPRGYLPQAVAEPRSLITAQSDASLRSAEQLAAKFESKLSEAMKKVARVSSPGSPLTRAGVMNNLNDFLTNPNREVAEQSLNNLPEVLRPVAKQMRNDIDKLSSDLLKSEFVSGNAAESTIRKIQNNIGSYMRRRYRVFEDADYTPDDDTLKLAFEGFKKDPAATQNELIKLADAGVYSLDELGLTPAKQLIGPVSDRQAILARDKFLQTYRLKNPSARGTGKIDIKRTPEYKLRNDLFTDRVELRDYQKALLGEIKNPVENFVATVADLSEFKAADEYYRKIAQLSQTDPGVRMLFRNTAELSDGELKRLTDEEGFKILGGTKGDLATPQGQQAAVNSGWGALYGYAVPERVYKDLTRIVAGDMGIMGNAARSLYSTFLRTKGASQYGTTVLSPPTQIRNATTGGFFAAMQGNIGSGANLRDSMRVVYNNLKDLPDEKIATEADEMVRLGLFGSQAELREMRDLLGKGLGFTEETMINGLPVGRKFGSKLTDNFVIGALAKGGKKAEKLYQGGDEFWKYYNFKFEENKLKNALKSLPEKEQVDWLLSKAPGSGVAADTSQQTIDRLIREEAARIVRNQVPNYNLVPEAVRAARKLPVGNFTAFPYEIMRTSANTIARGIEELADPNVEIQKIGLRRLMGSLATAGMFGTTMSALAGQLSDVTEEEIEAYKRSVAYPWERNARLIPVGRHEDGTPRFVNLSYSNPYDMIERMAVGALNKYADGQLQGKNAGQLVFESGSEALYELFSPFTDESMVTAALRDVLDPESKVPGLRQLGQLGGGRAGRTIYGAEIYNPEASAGEKLGRSFLHVADSILPNIVPVSGSSGELEPSRFARGFINSLGLNETLGITENDRLDRERELSTELARVFSGISETESQLERSLYYKAAEFAGARSDASRMFNSITNRPNATREQLLSAYERANEARFRAFQRFNQVLRDAESLGLNRAQIRRVLKDRNISGVNEVIRGRYAPLNISDTAKDNLRRNGLLRELPTREINQIRAAQRRREFAPIPEPVFEETDSGAEPLPTPTELQPAPVETAPGAPMSVAPVSPVPATRQAPAQELLGGNLFDRLRNLEIFQRQQQ